MDKTTVSMSRTYLGLGSNKGDREENLKRAVVLIKNKCRLLDYSSIYQTSPVGYTDQPYFLNMVIKIDSESYTPLNLLVLMKDIEKRMGRKKAFRWGPRLIDIDILYIEGISVKSKILTIPHKEMFNRNFVLIPLSEITDYLIISGRKVFLTKYEKNGERGASFSFGYQEGVSFFKSKDTIGFDV